ncbi:MAG: YkgJ family cysteine cluster protein [Candidatus Methanomethylophilaceae archaeon]|jgi:Fe-S-cluster containining protein
MGWQGDWKERAIRQALFKCAGCGRCCREFAIIDLSSRDLHRLARHFHENLAATMVRVCAEHPVDKGRFIFRESGPCKFYKNGCRIYETRPIVCRLYPYLGGDNCLCEAPEIEVPDMDNSALWIALAKSTGLAVTEMIAYLKTIGAWSDDA